MAGSTPSVSVVIPLYDKERYIARAVQSVLKQTCRDFELIVVDDGSTDASASVVESIEDVRIRLIRQENSGECAARNRGIEEASTDLIAFLDADDEWLPGFLETILRLQREFPGCGAYATAIDVVDAQHRRQRHRLEDIPESSDGGIIPNYFRSVPSDPVCSSAVAIPRRVFDSVGLFPVGVTHGGDLDMWCRVALKYPVAYSPQVGAVYHKEAENRVCVQVPCLGDPHSQFKTIDAALDSGSFPPGVTADDLVEYRNGKLIGDACVYVTRGQARQARKTLNEAVLTRVHRRWWVKWYLLSFVPYPWLKAMLRMKGHPGSPER
jgi:glycosyltransferase involved in cell wall biosynthesis